jgi:hypothetical protein
MAKVSARTPDIEVLPPVTLPALDPDVPVSPPEPGRPDRVALLVCHGMGQQVRFETLMDVARALRRAEGAEVREPIVARPVRIGDKEHRLDTHRAEMTLRGFGGNERQVHLYEAYWAPITEGRVRVRDVIAFLVSAGWNGAWHTSGGTFQRWMFGRSVELPIEGTSTRRKLVGAVVVVLSLVVINAVIAVAGFSRLVGLGRVPWPSSSLLLLLAMEVLVLLGLAIVAGGLVAIARSKEREPGPGTERRTTPRTRVALAGHGIWAALLGTVGLAVAMVIQLIASIGSGDSGDPVSRNLAVGLLVLWAGLLALSRRVGYYLVQFVGDVAVYVSAHTVSRFYEVRTQIQRASCSVARALYTALRADRGAFEYGRIIVVGHSLGSVVAYDTLNAMIRDDRAAATPFNAADRTPLLLTFGSPLNKTAFIFRTQMPEGSELREALAASVQPMIQSYDLRPARWINIYSPADWISGPIQFYDDPDDEDPTHKAKKVQDEVDPEATTPLTAHTEYWKNRLLGKRLVEAILQ